MEEAHKDKKPMFSLAIDILHIYLYQYIWILWLSTSNFVKYIVVFFCFFVKYDNWSYPIESHLACRFSDGFDSI